MPALKDIQDKLVRSIDESERIRAKYAGKQDNMTAEDVARWSALLDEADGLKVQIDLARREESLKTWASTPGSLPHLAGKAFGGDGESTDRIAANALQRATFNHWLKFGVQGASPEGMKALSAVEGDLGGFLVIPQELVTQLIVTVKDIVYVRKMATVQTMDRAESLGVPVLDSDLSDPTWTTELATGALDATAPFGKRELAPHPLAKAIQVSNKLLRQSSQSAEAIVMDRLAYKFGIAQEKAFMTGSGAQQPLGLFTASANGIDTSRDTTAAGSTTIAADDLITTKHALKGNYWPKGVWIMHRLVLAATRKLKDSSGNYLWQPGLGGYVAQGTALVGANPETLLGAQILMSEYAPSTFTTGLYMALFGDLTYYWIADALNLQIQRLVELYALTNQTGYVGRWECDGMPVLAEAFVRLKLA